MEVSRADVPSGRTGVGMKRLLLSSLLLLSTLSAQAEPDFSALGQQALTLSQEYIRIPSINPPADTTRTAAFLKAILDKEGIEAKLYTSAPGKVNLLARLKGRKPGGKLLLLHHMDVVPADPARWPVDPFSATVKDGLLYGRGAVDMKTTGILQLLTLITLKREKVILEHDVLLLASADEESGGEQGAQWMIKHHWEDMQPEYVLDEGGFGTRDLLSAENKLIFGIAVSEKKILWAKLIATGTSGHASQPVPDNANDRLLKALTRLDAKMNGDVAHTSPLVETLRQRSGKLSVNKFTKAIQKDTVSLTSLRSGVGDPPKVNVIPSRAEATLDFRLLPDTDLKAFKAELAKLWSDIPGLTFEEIHSTEITPISPHQTALFESLQKAVQREYAEAVVTPYLVPFGTDSNGFRLKGAKAYGFVPAIVNASIVASMHSDAERLPVDQFTPALRIYYRAVLGYVTNP